MILAIDASRCRSGGAVNHIKGILNYYNPELYGIKQIHIWAYDDLLNGIPEHTWLDKHYTKSLNKTIVSQLFWQYFSLPKILKNLKCDILYTVDASSVCRFKSQIVFSQDLLSYEPGIEKLYGFSFMRFRLIMIRVLQNIAFKNALGVVFLTNYTAEIIQKHCGALKNYKIIPHGFNEKFLLVERPVNLGNPIVCTYISNTDMYKNQWSVIKSIESLRNRYNIKLVLVGGGNGRSLRLVNDQVMRSDPFNEFVMQYGFLTHEETIDILRQTDIYVFASSCETFGITLLEGMAAGMTIACSSKSSLPELIEDGAVFFDPTNPSSISSAIEELLNDNNLRLELALSARALARKYSWQRCSEETFNYIVETYNKRKNEYLSDM
jgi:glycosyltransferase involved in cell wall biosynthesis